MEEVKLQSQEKQPTYSIAFILVATVSSVATTKSAPLLYLTNPNQSQNLHLGLVSDLDVFLDLFHSISTSCIVLS